MLGHAEEFQDNKEFFDWYHYHMEKEFKVTTLVIGDTKIGELFYEPW